MLVFEAKRLNFALPQAPNTFSVLHFAVLRFCGLIFKFFNFFKPQNVKPQNRKTAKPQKCWDFDKGNAGLSSYSTFFCPATSA